MMPHCDQLEEQLALLNRRSALVQMVVFLALVAAGIGWTVAFCLWMAR